MFFERWRHGGVAQIGRLWVTLLAGWATQAQGNADEPPVAMSLSAKPKLCVTDRADYYCEMDFQLHWESSQAGEYCLFLHKSEHALQCWLAQSQGQWEEKKTIQKFARFWMRSPTSTQKLAEIQVHVININPPEKRRNRRRRHVWSLF